MLADSFLHTTIYKMCQKDVGCQDNSFYNLSWRIFILYIFSREAGAVAVVRLQPLRSYRLAFTFDSGFLHVINQIFTQGLSKGFNSIHIESTESLKGIILNILLFIPFGYMLPCIFGKLQKALWGVVLIGFVCSLLTEVVQLVTHLGWFDLDDLLNNTIGCVLGVILYRGFLRIREV